MAGQAGRPPCEGNAERITMTYWFHRKTDNERIRELETEVEILKSRIAILDDQNTLLAKVNAFNARHIEDVTGRLVDYDASAESRLNVAGSIYPHQGFASLLYPLIPAA